MDPPFFLILVIDMRKIKKIWDTIIRDVTKTPSAPFSFSSLG